MNDLDLLIDLHRDTWRQGPGGEAETRLAIGLSGLAGADGLKVADIGCGAGAASLLLAGALEACVTAIDLVPAFLERARAGAVRAGLGHRIGTCAASMTALPFGARSFDAIWSEGAIYNMGFQAGIGTWRHYLRPGGVLAVSELIWLTAARPAVLERHWKAQYPEVDTAAAKLALLEANGYAPLGFFVLPRRCWLENYYRPLEARFDSFLARHGRSTGAQALVAAEVAEIALYERFADFYGYGYFVARKIGD